MLRGHTAPIFSLDISSDENKIFSIATDNTIKIWDIQSQTCIFSTCSKSSGIRGELTACLYIPSIRALCVTTDAIALLQIKLKSAIPPHLDVSHKESVLCCKYNRTFRQVVTCSEASVVKVWDFETGKQVFEFTDAHGDAAITCATFDHSGRRLITGGRDGCLKIWNHNTGQCLHTLKRGTKSEEVCDCTYVEINRNNYIMAVGWDRRINMYFDSENDLHHIQEPQPCWQDDLVRGHCEDILCIAENPPNLLASSSYDGEIIVWNMISGHIHCRLNSPVCAAAGKQFTDRSMSKILFLRTRTKTLQPTASLLSNGPRGSVSFWSLLQGGKMIASFKPSRVGSQVSSLAVNEDDTLMFAADHTGYIYVYDIADYAMRETEKEPAKLVAHWRAHVDMITQIEVIDEDKVILSCSMDGAVRLWGLSGEFIGTFGQSDPWEIFTPASWKHPMVPFEILIDPESLPTHPVLEEPLDMSDIISREKKEAEEAPDVQREINNPAITEEDIKEEINNQHILYIQGKRLRQERHKIAHKPLDHGGPNVFHTLRYFDLSSNPVTVEKPNVSAAANDPFQSFILSDADT
ncbi:hypothetical protein XELAEV_18013726mg [Xenopus laevis]|nr:hypothetical protein XELAEV_18013726mg [Xenopus laevis]